MEGLGSIPRDKRPSLEDLEKYETRYEPDTDYSAYMMELGMWISDFRRDEESERLDKQGRTPLMGHEDDHEKRNGYDPTGFKLEEVAYRIKSRPLH